MNKEAKNLVKKSAKIAAVTCVAAGAVALMTTGAALKALTEGARYLQNTVRKIISEPCEEEITAEAVPAEEECSAEPAAEEAAEENAPAEEV